MSVEREARAEAYKRYDGDRIVSEITGEVESFDDWGYADTARQAFIAGAAWERARLSPDVVEAAPSDTRRYEQCVLSPDGDCTRWSHDHTATSQPVQVEPWSTENLEIVNGWLVERGAHPLDYPAGAAYGAMPHSDAEPLVNLSALPGWPVQVEVTDDMVEKAVAAWWDTPDEGPGAQGVAMRAALTAALGGGDHAE